jgi:hypothetical protein
MSDEQHKSFRLTKTPDSIAVIQRLKTAVSRPLFLRWVAAVSVLFASNHVVAKFCYSDFGAWMYLGHIYGFKVVDEDSLSLTDMPRGRDWVVSNGDVVPNGGTTHFIYSLFLWIPVMLLVSFLITRVFGLHGAKGTDTSNDE